LNIARRSLFEVVNILVVANRRKYINEEQLNQYILELEVLSRKISNFRKAVLKNIK